MPCAVVILVYLLLQGMLPEQMYAVCFVGMVCQYTHTAMIWQRTGIYKLPLLINILESVNYTDCIIMGDFNFVCDELRFGYNVFKASLMNIHYMCVTV